MRKTKTTLLGMLFGAAWTATTLAATTFTIVRLTDQAGCSRQPSSSGNGKLVAFTSEADLVPPGNMDGNDEIFLHDQKKGLKQITTTTGGFNGQPSLSKGGTRIAFVSDRDLVPPGNMDGNGEIFLWDKKKGFTQVTDTSGSMNVNGEPVLSGSGSKILFVSTFDLVPGGNMGGAFQAYRFDVKKGLTQITSTTNGVGSSTLSGNGARIAFLSNENLTGSNADGSQEVFLFDKKGLRQISNGGSGCSSSAPALNNSGARVAFISTCDLVADGNEDGGPEVFLFDAKKGIAQITTTPALDMTKNDVTLPALDASGKRIAFFASADYITPGNADFNAELFLAIEKKGLFQLTHSSGGQGIREPPSLSANGKRIWFEHSAEHAPMSNPDGGGEIYLVEQGK